jgi:hypothetical protein
MLFWTFWSQRKVAEVKGFQLFLRFSWFKPEKAIYGDWMAIQIRRTCSVGRTAWQNCWVNKVQCDRMRRSRLPQMPEILVQCSPLMYVETASLQWNAANSYSNRSPTGPTRQQLTFDHDHLFSLIQSLVLWASLSSFLTQRESLIPSLAAAGGAAQLAWATASC